ncbi:hypothetical protein Tco_0849449 [Tanacetum coccineum]
MHRGNHRISQNDMLLSGNLISEVSQGKDGFLAGLPPYQNTKRNPRGHGRKIQTTTTHGNPGGEEKQQQVCDFHNDKGHNTDECMQLKKQIKELVRAGKLSYLIKEIKQGRDQTKVGKKKPRPKKSPWQSIWYNRGIELQAKLKMPKYYNARVRGVTFRPGDFVYRSNEASHAMDGGKLGPKWEGPYEVTEALRDVQAKVHRRRGLSADMENRQSQEILSLSYGMDKFVS